MEELQDADPRRMFPEMHHSRQWPPTDLARRVLLQLVGHFSASVNGAYPVLDWLVRDFSKIVSRFHFVIPHFVHPAFRKQ